MRTPFSRTGDRPGCPRGDTQASPRFWLPVPTRWLVLGVFVLSSALNYLDRLLVPALAPRLKEEFHLSNADYGLVLAAFSVVYAACAPSAGWFIDRIGLNRGISLAVGFWSLAAMSISLAGGLAALMLCYAALGLAQAGGIPASGKAIALYLEPRERALGSAVSQVGLSLGAMVAPPLGVWLALHYGWRWAFVVAGAAGLLWIPLWNAVARAAPAPGAPAVGRTAALLRDPRLWGIVAANVLAMTVYTLWSNWTMVFLVQAHSLSLAQSAWLAWMPPVAANLGGLAGGWLSMRWIRGGSAPAPARLRACLVAALLLLVTAAVPWLPGATLATVGICLSYFWVVAFSVNLYALPLDMYGAARAAFATAMLTSAYGAMQAVFSPLTGALIDRWGFHPVCAIVAALPLAAWLVLRRTQGAE
ncbi:MAG: MFS transporter [Acidobacteria bacterium]|nr:MFS transporter [Acidobacteriota bacterium]